jgi:Predicted endonuclease distantly related to archaeal Holliday junction resolvase
VFTSLAVVFFPGHGITPPFPGFSGALIIFSSYFMPGCFYTLSNQMNRQEVGKLGEKLAQKFLKKRGYHIRETNFRCRGGEIDIIAQQKNYLVFIEVRTKSSLDFGTPEESITQGKKEKLIALALTYINTHQDLPSLWRIDVVAIEVDGKGKAKRIDVIENAIEGHCYCS